MIQENFYLFCRLITPQSFYLRQKLRGDRLYAAIATLEVLRKPKVLTRALLPCKLLHLFKEPDATPTCSILIQFKSNPVHAHKMLKNYNLYQKINISYT